MPLKKNKKDLLYQMHSHKAKIQFLVMQLTSFHICTILPTIFILLCPKFNILLRSFKVISHVALFEIFQGKE